MTNYEQTGSAATPDLSTAEVSEMHHEPIGERVFVGTGLFWGLIAGVILALMVLILAAQNTGTITVSFLEWDFSTPLIVLILGAVLIGVVVAELFGLVYRKRRRRTLNERDELRRLR